MEKIVPFNFTFWFSGTEFSSQIEFNSEQELYESVENIELHFT